MKIKKLSLKQMENLEGGISDKAYWAILCSSVGALYGVVNFYLGIGVGYICAVYGPSLDVPPTSDYRDPGDLRSNVTPSGDATSLR